MTLVAMTTHGASPVILLTALLTAQDRNHRTVTLIEMTARSHGLCCLSTMPAKRETTLPTGDIRLLEHTCLGFGCHGRASTDGSGESLTRKHDREGQQLQS